MKKIKAIFFLTTVTLLTFITGITSASACAISHYQPEVPQSLRK